jgi:O-antigen/teichoic acid export membrane protein
MLGYLRRLATTGFAYTASSVLSKLVAVALLPLYTRYLSPADYGAAEVMIAALTASSILIRFGVIEALLRFYYLESERPERVVATGFALLLWTTTLGAALAMAFAEPISEALLDRSDAGLARIAIGGLWVATLYEYLVALFRLDERARAYFFFTFANVALAVPLTVWLVVFEDLGAQGLLIGTYAAATPFLIWLLFDARHRLAVLPDVPLLRRMMRFGLPTMPAEFSLYALNFIDRIMLVRLAGLAEAGLYALAFRFSQSIQILVRGFKLAWPPLAYSIREDSEARRVYAVIVTWYAAIAAFAVIGMWLLARWLVRALAAPEFFSAFEAIGPLCLGAALYGLYLVLLVVLGRTGRTEFNFPATFAGTATNIGLNLALIPTYGVAGAGFALVGSYVVVLVLMYAFTQRLFPVRWEWRRLALVAGPAVLFVACGELLLPTSGAVGLLSRAALWLSYPVLLWVLRLPTLAERRALTLVLHPRALIASLRQRAEDASAAAEADGDQAPSLRRGGFAPEVYEVEERDEDRGGA